MNLKKLNKGKKILKSKTPKCFMGYFTLILGGILIIAFINLKLFEIFNPAYSFTFSYVDFIMIFLGVLILLSGLSNFFSYVIIYENGVKVRKPPNIAEFLSYLIPRFILFKQIVKVYTDASSLTKIPKKGTISIQLIDDVYHINVSWILNSKDIVNELTARISTQNKGDNLKDSTRISFIKQNREFYGRYSVPPVWSFPEDGIIELDCYGVGTMQNPVIINNLLPLPKRVSIKNYSLFFKFENLSLKKLYLEHCENFNIMNCEIDLIRMNSCTNINFSECRIPRELKLKECRNVRFERCLIRKAIVFKSNDIVIKNSLIIHLSNWMSKNNIYESNNIKELRTNVKQETLHKQNNIINNIIKRKYYKLKKLFPTGLKVLLIDKFFLTSMVFIVFYSIGSFLILSYNSTGQEIGFWGYVYPQFIFLFIALLYAMYFFQEYYYKIKFKIVKKNYSLSS